MTKIGDRKIHRIIHAVLHKLYNISDKYNYENSKLFYKNKYMIIIIIIIHSLSVPLTRSALSSNDYMFNKMSSNCIPPRYSKSCFPNDATGFTTVMYVYNFQLEHIIHSMIIAHYFLLLAQSTFKVKIWILMYIETTFLIFCKMFK